MKVVYNEEDEQFDVSDEGLFAQELEDDTEVSLAIEKLPQRQRTIAELILEGKTQHEIANITGLNQSSVSRAIKRIKTIVSSV